MVLVQQLVVAHSVVLLLLLRRDILNLLHWNILDLLHPNIQGKVERLGQPVLGQPVRGHRILGLLGLCRRKTHKITNGCYFLTKHDLQWCWDAEWAAHAWETEWSTHAW